MHAKRVIQPQLARPADRSEGQSPDALGFVDRADELATLIYPLQRRTVGPLR